MAMQSVTIELNRFGDPEGVLTLSETYLRAIGNEPIVEASIGLKQKAFSRRMKKLGYDRFRHGSADDVRTAAETALAELIEPISGLLPVPEGASGELRQMDIVTNALELAQLPFEVLEENRPDIVLTRRVRQPWPRPPVVLDAAPKVLFVWAEPFKRNSTTRRQTVPHAAHRDLLDRVLSVWFTLNGREETLVEIANATFDQLKAALRDPEHGFTHVHILAHGHYDEENEEIYLLLEDDEGRRSLHSSKALRGIYDDPNLPRPGTVILATCHGGEIDPLEAGGTLGQVLHEAGVPVVLASQLALTQTGSCELVREFLARVVNGEDPRRALRACRDVLREQQDKTYYDRVALVGYVHLAEDFADHLPDVQLTVALARLEAASRSAAKAETTAETRSQFARVRAGLEELDQSAKVHGKLHEELLGLRASSLKRESESEWTAALSASPEEQKEHVERSREALRAARIAYGEAAVLSRDHHWTAVQSLVLDAVVDGSLVTRRWDWIAACQASRDAVQRSPKPIDRLWGLGSIAELHILAPLVGEELDLADEDVRDLLEIAKSEGGWPLSVVVRQLDRYLNWWGTDDIWKLPGDVLYRVRVVRSRLVSNP